MALLQAKYSLFFLLLVFSCITVVTSARHHPYTPPKLKRLTDLFPRRTFNNGFSHLFGESNLQLKDNGSSVNLALDKNTGSGFVSENRYQYGFFSTAMKLPPGFSSGVVVAFYLSNADVFPNSHDEMDFELLGHENRKEWIVQTNIYGNGSVKYTGREEKLRLWFDPTKEFHEYSIIWNPRHIVFLVDNIPIREATFSKAMSSVYPSKPMLVYTTIWDGSDWATNGGKDPVNYKYAPFVASFKEMEMEGCIWDQTKQLCTNNKNSTRTNSVDPIEGEDFIKLSDEQKKGMEGVRKSFMVYSYCKDSIRFKNLPPECNST